MADTVRTRARQAHPAIQAAPGLLRLTRRGRVVVLLVSSALLLAAFSIGRVSSHAAGPASAAPTHSVVLHAGDTLWSIARRVAPHDDPRTVVARIVALNHLPSVSVRAGQRLVVPGR